VIGEALADVLLADSAVTAIVGARITPVTVVLDAGFPSISFRRVSAQREYALSGAVVRVTAIYQITCWGLEYADADGLADVVRKCLDTYGDDETAGAIRLASVNDAEDEYAEIFKGYGCNLVVTLLYEEEV
jgi:hypothetical protein